MRQNAPVCTHDESARGLTKREYMATTILAGIMANPEDGRGMDRNERMHYRISKAIRYADILIWALNEVEIGGELTELP